MSVRTFLIGLIFAFGVPWLLMVAVPHAKINAMGPQVIDEETGETYPPSASTGFMMTGHQIYMQQGCVQCHTQIVRPPYIAYDQLRKGWGGEEERKRETRPLDYFGLNYAPIGVQRIGPDLANVATRIDDPDWHYLHLYNPRAIHPWSNMPSYRNLFVTKPIGAGPSENAVLVDYEAGTEIVPGPDAKALVTYLLNLRKDAPTGEATDNNN